MSFARRKFRRQFFNHFCSPSLNGVVGPWSRAFIAAVPRLPFAKCLDAIGIDEAICAGCHDRGARDMSNLFGNGLDVACWFSSEARGMIGRRG